MSNALALKLNNADWEEDSDTRQYVTFQLADERFGFPMAAVREIIRIPVTERVPLTSGALVGLANLRGSVLPVIDLRRLLKLEVVDYNEANRVIVVDVGSPVGLVVDRVARVMDVEPDRIENGDQVQSVIDADLLTGVVKDGDGTTLTQLLNIEQLLQQEFSSVTAQPETGGMGLGQDDPRAGAMTYGEEEETTDQLVSFTVEGQEFAFPLADVEEIVRLPEDISRVPRVDEHVLGLINLRGSVLPLVSLRRLFGLAERELDDDDRVVVASLRRPGGHRDTIGLVVDDVREVLRVAAGALEPVPKLLVEPDGEDDIKNVCCLDGGKRLVSLLKADALFAHPVVMSAIESRDREHGGQEVEKEQVQDIENDDDTIQMVVFRLADQEYGVSIDDVQEITRLPEQLDRVPKTPDFIEGMMNLRGMVLPVLDMRVRFELEKMERNERQRIIVLGLGGTRTGFIVDSVAEVLRLPREWIEAAPSLSADQARIMGRVVNLRESGRMIQVVTARELLSEQEKEALRDDA